MFQNQRYFRNLEIKKFLEPLETILEIHGGGTYLTIITNTRVIQYHLMKRFYSVLEEHRWSHNYKFMTYQHPYSQSKV